MKALDVNGNTTKEGHDLSTVESQANGQLFEDVFSNENGEVNFRGVSWQAAAVLVAKFQIGLGALSLPRTFHVLEFFPGILCFLVLAMISTVAGYLCGNARQYYPHMHSIADASELLFGKGAREVVGFIYYLYLAMTAGAGLLTTSVAFNALSEHGACTTVFVGVTSVAAFLIGTGFRGLQKVAWISWVGVTVIFIAIWTTAIACLTQSRPAAGPASGPIDLDVRAFPNTTFPEAMTAISNQLFAVGASATFFSISAEMKHPEKFTRALICGQTFIVATCVAIATIVYAKVGQYLASPALGSAGPLIKKVSYGIALPGLLVTAVLYSHIAAKYCFVRFLRGTRHLQANTVKHWAVWVGSMLVTVVFGFVIVGVVPFFSDFLSLVGALVNPFFTNVVPGFMLLFYVARKPLKVTDTAAMLRREQSATPQEQHHWLVEAMAACKKGEWKDAAMVAVGLFMILSGAFIIVGGTYSTILSIKKSYSDGLIGGVFSCGDNSI